METTRQKLIRYAISTAITFFTTFGLAFLISLEGILGGDQVLNAALFFSLLSAAAIAGTRAVIKLLVEKLSSMVATRKAVKACCNKK